MCQPKDKGGKRCLRHAAGTTVSVRYTEARLVSVTREDIYDVAKELNKEGRKLPTPSVEEVHQHFDKERFMAQLDPELEEKERKLIVKNIEKAKLEAEEQGVTGGAFHAWKNLFQRSVEKFRRPIVALALSTALIGSLAACTGGDADPNKPAPSPSETSISQPIGVSAVPGETVTDQYGDYQKLEAAPGATFDESVVDKVTLEQNGLTVDDAKAAHQVAVEFIVEDVVDHPAVDFLPEDFTKSYAEWQEKSAPRFTGTWYKEDNLGDGGYMLRLIEGLPRDGNPRMESISVIPTSYVGYPTKTGGTGIQGTYKVTTEYRVTDSWLQQWGEYKGVSFDESILADGKANVIKVERDIAVNVSNDGLISGLNFYKYDPEGLITPELVKTSKF